MTLQDKMRALLTENGLWPQEAAAVLIKAKGEKALESMTERWNDDLESYAAEMLAALWVTVQHVAAKWLAENKPKHFARPLFDWPQLEK